MIQIPSLPLLMYQIYIYIYICMYVLEFEKNLLIVRISLKTMTETYGTPL